MEQANPAPIAITAVSGTTAASGDTVCVTPGAGKVLRIHYLAYNPAGPVTLAFRFGSGPLFLMNTIAQGGAVVAKDLGDFRYLQGAVDEAIYLNLSDAVSTVWNVMYHEVGG